HLPGGVGSEGTPMGSVPKAVLLLAALALRLAVVLVSFPAGTTPREPRAPVTVEIGSSPDPHPPETGSTTPLPPPETSLPAELPPPPPVEDDEDDDDDDDHDDEDDD